MTTALKLIVGTALGWWVLYGMAGVGGWWTRHRNKDAQ